MPKEFIEKRVGSSSIAEARKQQEQLAYFTQSNIQKEITSEYIIQWGQRKYSTNDYFVNWIKTIFRTDNFLSFYKYLRHPVSSARLINDRVKPQLERVFFAEDSFFKYTIKDQEVQEPKELNVKDFNEWMFNALLFRHNDILITDLKDVNTPFRSLVSIENVVAIESHRSIIHRLAYTATVFVVDEAGNGKDEQGYLYMDAQQYIFYSSDLVPLMVVPHDLGECPADYVSKEPFANDDIVRKSIFSYVREELEEYVFLKTLQRMTEPNGAIPVVTQLKTKEKGNDDIKGESNKEPMQSHIIGGQRAEFGSEVTGSKSPLQAGSIIKVPMIKKDDGSLDMDAVKNFINFHFTPTAPLEYINTRIKEVEANIITTLLGDFTEQNQAAKNELQVAGSFFNKQDRLRGVSMELSRIRERSDYKFLALEYGKDNITNEAFYGSDFFLESQTELFDLFEKSPNTIERKNLLIRLTRNKNRFNKDKAQREVILYHLLPFTADEDFDKAIARGIDGVTFEYQNRFNYWVGVFEATYGDILLFWKGMEDISDSEKLIVINNLILDIINKAIVPIETVQEDETES